MNPLVKVTIFGLRGFATKQELRIAIPNGTDGSGLTYLTGPNNSGKSAIIEAFRAYLWRHNRPSYHEGMRNRRTNAVRIEFHYSTKLDWIETIRIGGSETHGNISPGTGAPYVVPSRRYFAPYFSRHSQIYDRQNFLFTSGDANHQQRGPALSQFEMRLFDIDRDDEKRAKFNEILSKIIPQGVNWSIDQSENSQYVLRFLGSEKAHSAEGVGEGVASLFTLIAAFYDSSPGDIIVIDEPELSLHPAYQKRLSKVISSFAQDRQIIISTHSPYMIETSAIRNGAELCRTWDRSDGTEIHQIKESGKSSWKKLTGINLNNPHQFALDAKEVFFLEDGVIVVEGQEDVTILPLVFSKLGAEVKAEFFGWGAGGAHNIASVLTILKELGFRQAAAIFDADKRSEMEDTRGDFPGFFVDCIPTDDIRDKKERVIQAKVGLLNSSKQINPDYRSEAVDLVNKLREFFD